MPGGGFGIYNSCTHQYPSTSASSWGAQYGGISSRDQCAALSATLQAGCYWRFDWFLNADNPSVSFKQVACPAALTAKSGCVRANDVIDEEPTGPIAVPTSTGAGGGTTTSATTTTSAGVPSGTGTPVAHFGQCGGIGYTGFTAVS